jgi:hypothetical protein
VKSRLLAFGGPFLYELTTAADDVAVEFYATTSPPKFRPYRPQSWDAEKLARHPIRRWTPADLPRLARRLRTGEYTAVLCQHIRYGLWSPVQPLLGNLRRSWQTLTREPASLIRLVLPILVRRTGVPMAFLSPEDSPTIESQNAALVRASRLCFVRELPVNPAHLVLNTRPRYRRIANLDRRPDLAWLWPRLRPLSLGLPERTAALIERVRVDDPARKDIDVFFAGWTAPHTARDPAYVEQLRSLAGRGWRVEIAAGYLPHEEFLARLARSWLVWSPQGLGWEGWRHYEAAAAGAVPVINLPTIRRYAPLEHGRHALFYGVEDDQLRAVVNEALGDKPRLWAMGQAARQHVLEHHRHRHLLQHVVSSLAAP